MDAIRVLVADEHPVYRDRLRTMLEATDDLTLVAEVCDGQEALNALADRDVCPALKVRDWVETARARARRHAEPR